MVNRFTIILFVSCVMAFCHTQAWAISPEDLAETRYVAQVERNADGSIKRSAAVVVRFKQIHPCPATGLTTGACPGWAVDHVIPLACGGRDAVVNMAWMPAAIKSCASPHCKDRWERKVYAADPPIEGATNCKREVVP